MKDWEDVTEAELLKNNPDLRVQGSALPAGPGSRGKKPYNKYRVADKADRTYNGVLFASAKEAKFAATLDLRVKAGDISFWLYNVPFRLPGGTKYVLDFMTFTKVFDSLDKKGEPEWTWHIGYIECKGYETAMGKLKRRQAESIFGIHIEVV